VQQADVINISGGQQSPEAQAESMPQRALWLCEDNNVLVVAAAGNDGCPFLYVPRGRPIGACRRRTRCRPETPRGKQVTGGRLGGRTVFSRLARMPGGGGAPVCGPVSLT
jgi:subtilisin family serine protease